jgi:hypothetical protein
VEGGQEQMRGVPRVTLGRTDGTLHSFFLRGVRQMLRSAQSLARDKPGIEMRVEVGTATQLLHRGPTDSAPHRVLCIMQHEHDTRHTFPYNRLQEHEK